MKQAGGVAARRHPRNDSSGSRAIICTSRNVSGQRREFELSSSRPRLAKKFHIDGRRIGLLLPRRLAPGKRDRASFH
jgi:hypothetical protein